MADDPPARSRPPLLPLARRGAAARVRASLAGTILRRANDLHLPTHSLALTAQQIMCTAPLLVAFSAFNRHGGATGVGGVLVRFLGLSGLASRDVLALFNGSQTVSQDDAAVGLVVALIFATSIAATQQRWYEMIWSQPRVNALSSTFRQPVWVAGLCAYLIVVLYAGRAGRGVGSRVHAGRPTGPLVQFAVSALFFWWSQHLLLAGRVEWRQLARGALCMGLGMTALVSLSGLVMPGQIVGEVHDYGLVGATFVMCLWLLVLSFTMFAGALIGEVVSSRRGPLRG